MFRHLNSLALFLILASTPLFAGDCDVLKATFEKWIAAYDKHDLAGTMEIFADDVNFSFQGAPDAKRTDLERDYRTDFAKADQKARWIPKFEEFECSGTLGFVRSTWQLEITTPDGKKEIKAENRSIDVLRLTDDGSWKIFRSLNYPVKAPGK